MYSLMTSRIKTYGPKIAILVCAIAVMILAWANLWFNLDAHAATLEGVSDRH